MNDIEGIVILAGLQQDGTTYQLHPVSREKLKKEFPNVTQAPTIFVGYDVQDDFETLHGPMWSMIAHLLTGVSVKKLNNLGTVRIRVPETNKEFPVGVEVELLPCRWCRICT
jgi:hypothetical protein